MRRAGLSWFEVRGTCALFTCCVHLHKWCKNNSTAVCNYCGGAKKKGILHSRFDVTHLHSVSLYPCVQLLYWCKTWDLKWHARRSNNFQFYTLMCNCCSKFKPLRNYYTKFIHLCAIIVLLQSVGFKVTRSCTCVHRLILLIMAPLTCIVHNLYTLLYICKFL